MKTHGYKKIFMDVDGHHYPCWYRKHRAKDGYVHDFVYKGQQVVNTSLVNGEAKVLRLIRESL